MIYKLVNRMQHPTSNRDMDETFSDDNESYEARCFFARRAAEGDLEIVPEAIIVPIPKSGSKK